MSDTFLTDRARQLSSRLAKAHCWHSANKPFGKGLSTKWWDLLPADVEEASIRLRELAGALETRGDA